MNPHESEYEGLLRQCRVTKGDEALAVASKLLKTKSMYADASLKTGVPLVWLMAINERESGGRLDTYLGDGELLTHKTIHVPQGHGPFATFSAGAIDALDYMHLAGIGPWTWAFALWKAEAWNGFGPRNHGRHSGYLWAGTNIYDGGKYTADGVWNPGIKDEQLGIVPLILALIKLDPSLQLEGGIPASIPGPQPSPPELSGMQHGMSWLQDALNHVQATGLAVDGSYGRKTAAAVRAFQGAHGLAVDGVAGPLTIAALEKAMAPAAPAVAAVLQPAPKITDAALQALVDPSIPAVLGFVSSAPEPDILAERNSPYPIYDHDLAMLCRGLYSYPNETPVQWDHFDAGEDDTVCWAVKRIGDVDVVVFRGSTTLDDFVDDAEALATTPPGLDCPVHRGFNEGLAKVVSEVAARNPQHVIVTGHSLGAARASIFSAYMKQSGKTPLARVMFGEPRPGYPDLAKFLEGVPCRNYRNGRGIRGDLITGLPFSVSFMPWVNTAPFTEVNAPPAPDDVWGPFSWHRVQLYCAALSTLNTSTTPQGD